MKGTLLTITKKELTRFFGDRRLLLSTVLLPGLMIYLLYTVMGNAITSQYTVDEAYQPTAVVEHMPESLAPILTQTLDLRSDDDPMAAVQNRYLDLYLCFPADFEEAVAAYDVQSGVIAPQVEIYYNSSTTPSSEGYAMVTALLDQLERSISNKFDVNLQGTFDLATEKDTSGFIFSSMMPMLLMIFLFSGCTAVAPGSIAGEKERGTIATLLVTPASRSAIALGKITALSIIALLAGASSAIGTILSLPKLMGMAGELAIPYTIQDYLMLSVIILSTVLLLITVISVISAIAKSVKEAQTYLIPLNLASTLIGASAMFSGGAKEALFYYLIPLYNSVQAMTGIFSFTANPSSIAATVISNLLLSGVGVLVLTKLFNSERIVYSN